MDFMWRILSQKQKISRIEKSTDQALLSEIAENEPDLEVRLAAVDHINDPDILYRTSLHTSDEDVSLRIVERLQDQKDLSYLARSAKCEKARHAALAKITDQNLIIQIATDHYGGAIRSKAVEYIDDQNVLFEIFQKDDGPNGLSFRIKVMHLITEQGALGKIALHGRPNEREYAYERLTDEQVIARALVYEKEDRLFRYGLSKIKDKDIQKAVANQIKLNGLLEACCTKPEPHSFLSKNTYFRPISPAEKVYLKKNIELIKEMIHNCPLPIYSEYALWFMAHYLDAIGLEKDASKKLKKD